MNSNDLESQLTDKFRARVEATGLTQDAIARAICVSEKYFKDVWEGRKPASHRFMTAAVLAGLGETYADIAEPAHQPRQTA